MCKNQISIVGSFGDISEMEKYNVVFYYFQFFRKNNILGQWLPIRSKARTPSARKNHSRTPCTVLHSHAVSVQTVA